VLLVEHQLHVVVVDLQRLNDFSSQKSIWNANVGAHEVPVPIEPGEGDLLVFAQDLAHRDDLLMEYRGGPNDEDGAVEVAAENPETGQEPGDEFGQEDLLRLASLNLHLGNHSPHVESKLSVR